MVLGTLNTAENFLYHSPDLCPDRILSLSYTGSSFDLMVNALLCIFKKIFMEFFSPIINQQHGLKFESMIFIVLTNEIIPASLGAGSLNFLEHPILAVAVYPVLSHDSSTPSLRGFIKCTLLAFFMTFRIKGQLMYIPAPYFLFLAT